MGIMFNFYSYTIQPIKDYLKRRRAGKKAEQDVINGRKLPTVGTYANDPEGWKDVLRASDPEKFGDPNYVFEFEKNMIKKKYCTSCGAQLPGNALFCGKCGSKQR